MDGQKDQPRAATFSAYGTVVVEVRGNRIALFFNFLNFSGIVCIRNFAILAVPAAVFQDIENLFGFYRARGIPQFVLLRHPFGVQRRVHLCIDAI